MSIDTVFPPVSFTETEETIIREMFSSPIVKKYLRRMAAEDAKELLSLSGISVERDVIHNAHLVVEGKLNVITTLLSIGVSQNPASNEVQNSN
jgi:hypothetical protein